MTHLADKLLKNIIAGLDGVTPGPWQWEDHEYFSVVLNAVGDIVFDSGGSDGCSPQIIEYISPLGQHLARCDPDTFRQIEARQTDLITRAETAERDLAAAQAECARMREALQQISAWPLDLQVEGKYPIHELQDIAMGMNLNARAALAPKEPT